MIRIIYLLLLFILSQFALLARYIVFGAFEPFTYAATFLAPLAALFIYYRSKKSVQQEQCYIPPTIDAWSFLNKQRTFCNDKALFYGDAQRGTVTRQFHKRWHYVVSDLFGTSFFLTLRIVIDDQEWLLTPTTHWLASNTTWRITRNGVHIGEAHTRITWKNTKRFIEMIDVTIGDKTYTTTASTITSSITVTEDNTTIGIAKRHHLLSNIQVVDAAPDEEAAVVAAILHAYSFKEA